MCDASAGASSIGGEEHVEVECVVSCEERGSSAAALDARGLPIEVDAEVLLGQLAETDDWTRHVGDDEGDDRVDGAVE